MKRIRAIALPLLVCIALFPPALAAAADRVPLPDRNPNRAAVPAQPAPDSARAAPEAAPAAQEAVATGSIAAGEQAAQEPAEQLEASNAVTEVAAAPKTTVVHRNAKLVPPSLLAPPSAPLPSAPSAPHAGPVPPVIEGIGQIVKGMPLPAPNPNRPSSAALINMKGTLAPAIKAPPPALDYAAVLKPLLTYELTTSDHAYVREVMRGAGAATAQKIKDPAARAFALWHRYRNGPASSANAEAIEAFRLAEPLMPAQDELREKAETALLLGDTTDDNVKEFFANSEPQTGAGKAALAGVRLKEGNQEAAKALVVSAWRDHRLNAAVESKILARYGLMLTAEHHKARIDQLLFADDKSVAEPALRVAKLLPPAEKKKVDARIAVLRRGGNAGTLLDQLGPKAVEADAGLRFNHIQWLRRTKDKERRERAWKMLLDAPSEPNLLLDLNNWWTERRIACRGALNDGNPRVAYEIAAKHGLVSGDSYIEAEFMAGWIALRFLSEPHRALRHFLSLRSAATSSKSIALGEYWLGRTALALGDRNSALIHFHGAAKYPQYFYGQLGRQALDVRPAHLDVTRTPVPTEEDIKRFFSRDAVRAMGVAKATGYAGALPQFMLQLARKLDNASEVVLVAEFAKATGHQQLGLRLSKIAFNRDLALGDYALPVGVMPDFKSLLTDRVDPALVHALSRQESEFNAAAKSPVGASGLMQLMPGTARATARAYKVKYDPNMLTNASYNTQLGEAHLRDLIDSYGGSYILSLAAYNAGGGRVAEWIKLFGDPRDPNVDPVDWIERIPFTETRQYVIKITEALQLYRSRLAGPKRALQLVQDLNRGRRLPRAAAAQLGVKAKSE
ncbi:MAG TPA: lytic transglycosylase domain-containing protein [Methyloceanibacter sp.]|jgi:soluble lytic murein transglycosylase|nr:lytic transglycosylase domain-containing protein [Methyloceanibacter sp.]